MIFLSQIIINCFAFFSCGEAFFYIDVCREIKKKKLENPDLRNSDFHKCEFNLESLYKILLQREKKI